MKGLITISLLLFSPIIYAQTNNAVKPDSNPKITISPAASTKITNQPASIPNSNTNPTTGTVIKLKTKNANKTRPQDKSKIDSPPVLSKTDSTSTNNRNKSTRKRTTKKNKS